MSCPLMRSACILCVSVLLYGCATPRPVLDLATRGVGAATSAEAELQRYLAAAQDQLSARVVIVRQLSGRELEESYKDTFANFLRERTGDKSGEDIASLMRTLGQERRRLREQLMADAVKLDDVHKKALGDAVGPPAEAFAATRKAFMLLAQELSPQEWLALTAYYAREIHDTVKKIKEEAKADAKKAGGTDEAKTEAKEANGAK